MATLPPDPSTPSSDPRAVVRHTFPDNRLLIGLCGPLDAHLAQIERLMGVVIARQGNAIDIQGTAAVQAAHVLVALYQRLEQGKSVDTTEIVAQAVRGGFVGPGDGPAHGAVDRAPDRAPPLQDDTPVEVTTRKRTLTPHTPAQRDYARALMRADLTFGLGPAGTGKTYIAVAVAVNALINGLVERIVLSRPAVEAGERLGFLPGDMKDKVDPYMQPLYDALHDFVPAKQLARMIETRRVEIAPLAFMRGRTLVDAFVVLDEAQNATPMQMKMFLTRLGPGSRMAITGDCSQVDLPRGVPCGLRDAVRVLSGVTGVAFIHLGERDVVRHPLVARIIRAYDRHDPDG